MKKQTVFMKMFIIYLVIVFMYTLIASTVFFFKNNEIVELEMNNNQNRFFTQAVENIETKFTVAMSMVNLFKTSEELIVYARDQERNYYHITRVFNNLLSRIGAFDEFGFTVDIVKKNDDLVITRSGTKQKDKYYETKGFTEPIVRDIEAYMASGDSQTHLIESTLQTDRGPLIGMVRNDVVEGNVEVVFFISFYEEVVLPRMDDTEAGFGFMKGGEMISMASDLEEETILAGVTDESYESNTHTIHRLDSEVMSDLSYLFITPKDTMSDQVSALIIDTLKIYLVLFLFGLILSFLAARNLYKPIRAIVNILRGDDEKSGQNEFSFIREKAINIKEANKRLSETLHHNRISLKNKFLRDLLAGLVPSDQAARGIEEHGLKMLNRELMVIIFEFIDENRLDDSFSKDAVLEIKSQTIRIIDEKLRKGSGGEIIELDYKRYVMILHTVPLSQVKKQLSQVLSAIEIDFDIRIVASLGHAVQQLQDIYQSFYEALQLLEQRLAVDKRTILTTADIGGVSGNNYFYPLELERELISYVIQGKTEQVNAIVHRVFELNVSKTAWTGESLSGLLLSLVGTVHRILQQINKSEDDFFEEGTLHYAELKKLENTAQMQEKFESIFDTMITRMKQQNAEADDSIADEMIAFVHENYHRDISLNDLAELFNFSPGYISVLFKNHVGGNFKNYLNIYRINKAKELIENNPRLAMNEVSEKVGFNHVNTFIRLFKKYEGVSPGQYTRKREGE